MADNGNVDDVQPTHRENDRQAQNTTRPPARPGPTDAAHTTVALAQRAPTAPIPTRTWTMYFKLTGHPSHEFKYVLGQENHCTRSQTTGVRYGRAKSSGAGRRADSSIGVMEGLIGGFIEHETEIRAETSNERVGFPYPSFYRKLLINGEPPETLQKEPQKWDFHNAFAEGKITKEWEVAEYMVIKHAIYVVVGIFPHGHANPRERVVFVKKPEHLFWGLLWASLRLRGVFGTFLSLRHVKGFRLYKCNARTGIHERVDLDKNGVADLLLMGDTYKRWFVPGYIVKAWARWVHQELNAGSHDVRGGKYSLELILEWSATRIIIVVLFPVLLSLAVGLWLNAEDWTDLATIQTAWGTASYIVTAGGLSAALLGILSSIPG